MPFKKVTRQDGRIVELRWYLAKRFGGKQYLLVYNRRMSDGSLKAAWSVKTKRAWDFATSEDAANHRSLNAGLDGCYIIQMAHEVPTKSVRDSYNS